MLDHGLDRVEKLADNGSEAAFGVKDGRKAIALESGKYVILFDAAGQFPERALRYGKPWREDLAGDNLVFNLAWALEAFAVAP